MRLLNLGLLPVLGLFILLSLTPWEIASAHRLTTLYSFCSKSACADGLDPIASLVMDQSGNLYGTTILGGANNAGTVFELQRKEKNKWAYKILYSFCSEQSCGDGERPVSNLIIDAGGNLYGTTPFADSRPGKIFELVTNADRSKWKYKLLHAFCSEDNCADGIGSQAGLTYMGAEAGLAYNGTSPLYGTSYEVGSFPSTVFELTPSAKSWKLHTIYTFCSLSNCDDGESSVAPLRIDSIGNLFGTTQFGGQFGAGVIFELSRHKKLWAETVLHSFCAESNCADGSSPLAGLTADAAGNLLGTTDRGGASDPHCAEEFYSPGCGVAFKLSPNGMNFQETVLYDFCAQADCSDGAQPAGLLSEASGQLFGSTAYGGYSNDPNGYGAGTIFSLTAGQKALYRFCSQTDCPDGAYPSSIIANEHGKLFGITTLGGANSGGTIFEFAP